MLYGLNLADDGRILSACIVLGWHEGEDVPKTYNGMPVVEMLPDGDISDYRYVNDTYVHDPKPEEPAQQPTQEDKEKTLLKAQIKALSDRNDFLEDCVAEMASIVYA